ncbi:MAG: UDP-phosphate N-acetylglucosaminyl 1-phosphate transferase [Rhodobiaceae bacterium]|nr:UDP-phosphate N-acetylglucosaminyl 1-phosphate transferase [Rhodobiaceae bacterium]
MIVAEYDWLVVFLCAALSCGFLIVTKQWHMSRTARGHAGSAVQSAHKMPTPRIGGVAIGLALIASILFAPTSMLDNYVPFIVSLTPVFLAGLAEDFGYNVSPGKRLAAAAVSSVIAIALLGMWIDRTGIAYLDVIVSFAPVGIVLTVFATAGVCNAFNLIDGLNGLSAGTGGLVAAGIATIGYNAGNPDFAKLSILLIAALAGFLVFNFPLGKLFLGDAGAYSLGHILAWFGILLVDRKPEVTTWALLLVFFWPVADTLFAIARRKVKGRKFDQPDRLHFHQLIMRGLEIVWLGRGKRHVSNPLATLIMMPLIATPIVTGVMLWNRPLMCIYALAVYSVVFVSTYQLTLFLVRKKGRTKSSRSRGSVN